MKNKKQCIYCHKFFKSMGLHPHMAHCPKRPVDGVVVEQVPLAKGQSAFEATQPRQQEVSDHQIESIVDGVWEGLDLSTKVDVLTTHFHLRTGA